MISSLLAYLEDDYLKESTRGYFAWLLLVMLVIAIVSILLHLPTKESFGVRALSIDTLVKMNIAQCNTLNNRMNPDTSSESAINVNIDMSWFSVEEKDITRFRSMLSLTQDGKKSSTCHILMEPDDWQLQLDGKLVTSSSVVDVRVITLDGYPSPILQINNSPELREHLAHSAKNGFHVIYYQASLIDTFFSIFET